MASSLYVVDMSQMRDIPISWLRKAVTKVMVNDFNKNGMWDLDDVRTATEKIIKTGNLKGAKAEEVTKFYIENIPTYFHTATNLTEWLIGDFQLRNDPTLPSLFYNYMSKWFKIMDLDGNGVIDQHEFEVFWKAYDLDLRYLKHQFDYIDKDKDGRISCKEWVDAGLEYFFNLEKNENMFWGPVKDFQ